MSKGLHHVSDQIAGTWKQVQGEIRREWGKLTEDDVEQIKGHRAVLAGKIQQRYAIAREEAFHQIDKWAEGRRI
jgi:uncharacterized protein YjbJ (UPF0337 family)